MPRLLLNLIYLYNTGYISTSLGKCTFLTLLGGVVFIKRLKASCGSAGSLRVKRYIFRVSSASVMDFFLRRAYCFNELDDEGETEEDDGRQLEDSYELVSVPPDVKLSGECFSWVQPGWRDGDRHYAIDQQRGEKDEESG